MSPAFWSAQLQDPYARGQADRESGYYAFVGQALRKLGRKWALNADERAVLLSVFGERCPLAALERASDAILGAIGCAYHGLITPTLGVTSRGMKAAMQIMEEG